MQGSTANTRHGVTRKVRIEKDEKDIGNLLRKNSKIKGVH